jgi:hypothetical protein
MYKTKISKRNLTEIILKNIPAHLNYDLSGRYDADHFISKWWYTGRREGLRLTDEGDLAFRLAEIEYYEYPVGQVNYNYYGFLLDLNKKIDCPYFLGLNSSKPKAEPIIRLYDSKVAVMVSLYGTLMEYLENVRIPNARRK